MKCIRCEHDSKYRERTNKRCPNCQGMFAFEPRDGDALSDASFARAIEVVSSSGKVRWGVEHLYYEVCRRRRKKVPSPFKVNLALLGLFSAGLVVSLLFRPGGLVVVPGFIVFWCIVALPFSRQQSRLASVTQAKFDVMWKRWLEVHGWPANVIQRNPNPQVPENIEPDLGDYSFDRTVICDRARTVDLLLANNFHFENNCAVLSIEGYPAGPFKTVRAMLQRNLHLHVFALHDATVPGCRMADRLATNPEWFAGRVPVRDVGLRPRHAKRFYGLYLSAGMGKIGAGRGLTQEEALWLTKNNLELAVIRPEQVLKRLFKAINQKFDTSRDSTSDDDGETVVWVESDSSSFDGDAADVGGGADGFG